MTAATAPGLVDLPARGKPLTAASVVTLGQILATRAQDSPDALAFRFSRDGIHAVEDLSYADVHARAQRIAGHLFAEVPVGSRALLLFGPGLDFVSALFACLQAGVVAVSVMATQPGRLHRVLPRLERISRDAEVSVVLTTSASMQTDRPLFESGSRLAAARWIAVDRAAARDGPGVPAQDTEQLAFLQYTSGSTADPRAVMLSHANFLANSAVIAAGLRLSSKSRGFCWLPASHDMGLFTGILQPVILGFPTVLMPPLAVLKDPLRWLAGISRFGASFSGAPNFAYELAVARTTPEQRAQLSLGMWDVAFCGAEPVRAEAIEAFCDAFAPCGFRQSSFYPCYGLAEATLMVTGPRRRRKPTLLALDAAGLEARLAQPPHGGSRVQVVVGVGEAGDGHEIAIVNEHTLRRCAPGEVGEIWVSGPSVAAGYWPGEPGTDAEFAARIAGDDPSKAYLRTGDLGFLRDGELFVVGRIKDLLIIRGRNFHPHDLERAAESAHPRLRRSCSAAFSVDRDGGTELTTIVMEVDPDPADDSDDVIRAVRREVMTTTDVGLQWVVLVGPGEVPKTTSGKVQRRLCRARLVAGQLEPRAEWRMLAPTLRR
jgi:acyl-CoA synthetase (AMP-forming)/AMP-acid ligase II